MRECCTISRRQVAADVFGTRLVWKLLRRGRCGVQWNFGNRGVSFVVFAAASFMLHSAGPTPAYATADIDELQAEFPGVAGQHEMMTRPDSIGGGLSRP